MRVSKKNSSTRDFVSREVSRVLKEQNEWDGWMSDATASKFIAPFTNVLKVAKVAIEDILVSTLNVARQVFTFDLEKKKEIEDKYRTAKLEIEKDYAEAMKPIDDALASSDAKILGFALNPGLFTATALAKGAAAAGKPVIDYAVGKLDLPEFRADDDTNKDRDKKTADERGPLLGLMNDLNKIFFSPIDTASDILLASDDPLSEQQSPSAEPDEQALEISNMVLKDMGILDSVQAVGKKRVDEKIQEVKVLEKEFMDVMASLSEFKNSESIAQAKAAAEALKKSGLDLAPQISDLEKAISEQMKQLDDESGGSLKQKLLSVGSPSTEGMTIDSPAKDFRPVIEKTVIEAALKNALDNVREDMFKQVMSFAAEGLTEKELNDIAKVSPLGKKYADAILGLASRLSK